MAENSIFKNWDDVVYDGRNDLVFEKRHKDYGAYDIRKRYNNYISFAIIISCLLFVIAISGPKIYSFLTSTTSEDEKVVAVDMTQIELEAPPPVNETEPPPPPPPPPPPVMETVKFTPPIVVDEEVKEEQPIITQETETQISTVTQEGSGEKDEIIIPSETGTGVIQEENPETPFISVEEMPSFPGGEQALLSYLSKNINYPAMEKDAGISGTVYVYFVINKEGKVSDVQVKRGVKGGPGLDKEAMRVIKSMPNWSIGKQNGRPASVQFTLPVRFVLK
ncbi:MAG: energy transducer TonB [Bacteroidia bacterium]|nr:energy transducer TonB [Bacteroidia bacterium]